MTESAPSCWSFVRLGDAVGKITSGGTPKVGTEGYYGGEIPFLKIADLTRAKRIVEISEQTITALAVKETSAKVFPAKTVVTTMYGTLGVTRILAKSMATNQAIAAFLDLKHVTTEYLTYILNFRAPTFAALASQTTQANLSAGFLKDLKVLLPPLEEQERIAEILGSVDDVIEQTRTQIAKLQDLKTATMNELLTRGIGHTEFKDSELGRIPSGWEIKPLRELVLFQRGHDLAAAERHAGEVPVISSSGVTGFHDCFTAPGPGVVIGRKGNVGSVYFSVVDYWAHDTSLFSVDFFGNDAGFVYFLCCWMNLAQYATATGSPSLNRNDIHPIKVRVPPISEQKAICETLRAVDEQVSIRETHLAEFELLKKSLMQDLLTGKVRVAA